MLEFFHSFVSCFQVISAQQLPKPEHDKPTSIVDPQVWVEVHGVPIDNNKKKTHHVNNNGETRLPAPPLLCSVVCVWEGGGVTPCHVSDLSLLWSGPWERSTASPPFTTLDAVTCEAAAVAVLLKFLG